MIELRISILLAPCYLDSLFISLRVRWCGYIKCWGLSVLLFRISSHSVPKIDLHFDWSQHPDAIRERFIRWNLKLQILWTEGTERKRKRPLQRAARWRAPGLKKIDSGKHALPYESAGVSRDLLFESHQGCATEQDFSLNVNHLQAEGVDRIFFCYGWPWFFSSSTNCEPKWNYEL